jgi:hypothetical protein
MMTAGKFFSGSLALGALTVLGSALMQMSSSDRPAHLQGPLASVILAQGACQRVSSLYLAASSEISPSLRSFATVSSAALSSNATTAQLQLEAMGNAVIARLSLDAWLPVNKSGRPQMDLQATTSQTRAFASKLPVTKAVQGQVDRLSDLKPALSLSPYGF